MASLLYNDVMQIFNVIKIATKALVLAFLAYLNLIIWQSTSLGWVVFALFLFFSARNLHWFFVKHFGLSRSLRIRVLALFLVLAVLGSINGAFIFVSGWSPLFLASSIFITAFLSGILKMTVGEMPDIMPEIYDETKQVIEEFPRPMRWAMLCLTLISLGFYFLIQNQTNVALVSPWQAIGVNYIYIFFAVTLLLGLLVFSRLKSATMLFLFVAFNLLLHSYLPLSHTLFFGADGWRHMAVENNLLFKTTSQILISANSPTNIWQKIDFGSLAYSQFNALALFFKTFLGIELLDFFRWFMPLTWSLILPLALFEIGRALNFDKKSALFLVWLSALPFALQVSGSFTLPSNLGFLVWVVALLLQIKLVRANTWAGNIFIILLGLILFFGYSLYFILFWISYVLLKLSNLSTRQKYFGVLVMILTGLSIPVIELMSHFSSLNRNLNWLGQIKKIFINFSAWYSSVSLQSVDTSVGNIIFNQPPVNARFANIFIMYPQWIFIFMLVFWIVWILGVYKLNKNNERTNTAWLQLSLGLLISYIISRYFLSGENILTRRMDAILAFLIILPIAKYLYNFLKQNSKNKKSLIFLVVFIISAGTTASYTLGPDAPVLSGDEYAAMQNVWEREMAGDKKICVLADTYPLVALEALSARKVVGGGFPINLYFAQPEYVQLINKSKTDPVGAINDSKRLLNVPTCYLVGDYNLPNYFAKFGNIKVYNF